MFSSPGPRVELLGNFLANLAPGASEEEGGGVAVQVDQGDTPGAQDRQGLWHAQAAGIIREDPVYVEEVYSLHPFPPDRLGEREEVN